MRRHGAEAVEASGMARTLCETAGDNSRLLPAVRSSWEYYTARGDLNAACELAGQCQKLAAGAPEPDIGRRAQARDLLAPIFGWFEEGFETADLKDARALIDALQ